MQLIGTLLVLSLSTIGYSLVVDNKVVKDPEIECSSDSILVNVNTENPFEGHVYVKGHYNEVGCKTDATNTKAASITIPFSACGVKRQRSANPDGMFMITTVVISFHPQFVTMVDKAYNVKCFYMQADKSVSSVLDVSMLTTTMITQNVPMPTCKYQVLAGGASGTPLKYARIGDAAYHKWSCVGSTGDIFCMTVHSCFVQDGQSNTNVQLLDENGCAMDKYLLNNIEYSESLVGGQASMVFKFADKPTLFFNCQIKLTLKEGDQCKRMSDACPAPFRGKRAVIEDTEEGTIVDVFSEEITVLTEVQAESSEPDSNVNLALPFALQSTHNLAPVGGVNDYPYWLRNLVGESETCPPQMICLSNVGFGFLLAVLLSIVIASIIVVAVCCVRTRQSKSISA